MQYKVQVLFRDGSTVSSPLYMNVNDNDLCYTDTTKAGCNSKIIKAFDTSRTEYFVAETVDVLIAGANGAYNGYLKSYYALLSQSGTTAPTAQLMNNHNIDYLGNLVWTRTGAGVYRATLTSAFMPYGTYVAAVVLNDNTLATVDAQSSYDHIDINTVADGKLTFTPIEIRVFYNITAP